MILYARVVNDETKLCIVGTGDNAEFYESIGMSEIDVEQAYDGNWYLKEFVPEMPQSEKNKRRIDELKKNLIEADYWGQKYIDGEYTDDEWNEKKAQRKAWREEIRALEDEQ